MRNKLKLSKPLHWRVTLQVSAQLLSVVGTCFSSSLASYHALPSTSSVPLLGEVAICTSAPGGGCLMPPLLLFALLNLDLLMLFFVVTLLVLIGVAAFGISDAVMVLSSS